MGPGHKARDDVISTCDRPACKGELNVKGRIGVGSARDRNRLDGCNPGPAPALSDQARAVPPTFPSTARAGRGGPAMFHAPPRLIGTGRPTPFNE